MIHTILHVNIRVAPAALEECREFYCAVLGLSVGARPAFASVGYWLYAGGEPLVHLVAGEDGQSNSAPVTTALQHVAFGCSDLEAMLTKLQMKGVAYSSSQVPGLDVTQINFKDPAGVGIELGFNSRSGTTAR